MTEKEMLKISIEEFSRIQRYMIAAGKDSDVYQLIKERYLDLKVILTSSGINLTDIDRIKESVLQFTGRGKLDGNRRQAGL